MTTSQLFSQAAFALSLLSAALGIAAAYFWWESSRIKWEPVRKLPEMAADGVEARFIEGAGLQQFDCPKQSRLNSHAALLTGASVALQAIATLIHP